MRIPVISALTALVVAAGVCAVPVCAIPVTASAAPGSGAARLARPARQVTTSPWTVGKPLPQPRQDAAAEVFGSTLYAAGGTDASGNTSVAVYGYTATTRTWQAVAPMPHPRAAFALLHVGSYLYAVGGGLTSVDRFDPAANRWVAGVVAPAPLPIRSAALTTGTGLILAFAVNSAGKAVALTLDTSTDSWTQAAPVQLPGGTPGTWTAAAPLGTSDVMVLSAGRAVDYRPASNTYAALPFPQLSDPDCFADFVPSSAHRDPNGRIAILGVFGTCDFGGQGSIGAFTLYDPTTRRWNRGADAPAFATDAALAFSGGAMYAIGGIIDASDVTAEVDVLRYGTDHTPPTVTSPPRVTLSERDNDGSLLPAYADSVPVRVAGTATDPSTVSGTSLRTAGGTAPYGAPVLNFDYANLDYDVYANTGVAFHTQLGFSDGFGNATSWQSAPAVTPAYVDDSAASVHYTGTWQTSTPAQGVTHYTSAAGASATFTFTGTSFGWVSECELASGSAHVYVDGRDLGLVSQSCDDTLEGSGPLMRAVQSWPVAGAHTVRVVSTGGSAVVDVAGFTYLH